MSLSPTVSFPVAPASALEGRARTPLRAALLLFLAVALPAFAQEKPKDADVIYPRNTEAASPASAAKPAALPTRPDDGMHRGLLFLGLAAAAAGGWMLWRQRRSPAGIAGRSAKLAIAESRSLGNRQYLVVADYDGRRFLLGVCPGRIDLLSPLDDRPPAKSP